MNTHSALTEKPVQYFLRTPEGRKGVDTPVGLTEEERSEHLIEVTTEEAHRTGWAILDEVHTTPKLMIQEDLSKAAAIQAARVGKRKRKAIKA